MDEIMHAMTIDYSIGHTNQVALLLVGWGMCHVRSAT